MMANRLITPQLSREGQINTQKELLALFDAKIATIDAICKKYQQSSQEYVAKVHASCFTSIVRLVSDLNPELS